IFRSHHLGDKSISAAKTVLGDVAKVSANGSDSVVFELHSGNADFTYVVADYHLVIMPSKDGVPDWQAGVGTGGYRLKNFEPGVRMTLERSPDYWKAGRAHFASAELIAIGDGAARINALVTGQVDVINKVDLKTVALLKRNPNLVIEETKGAQHYTFPMLTDSPLFQNNDV
ncbi:peptide ABC transporter substrate-binding protein, partial [Pseudomonas sp. MWU12-2312b]